MIFLCYSDEESSASECSDSDNDNVVFYEGNPDLPVYYIGKKRGVDVVKVANVLLSAKLPLSRKVANRKPVAVSKNVAFVFDIRHFKDIKDILSDSLGVWICTGTKTFYCSLAADQERVTMTDAKNYGERDSVFKIERRFYKNKAAEDVKRNFTMIRSEDFIMLFCCFFTRQFTKVNNHIEI